jgi:cytosine/adenosine deaminase-related metal-dependent hydrolase
VLIEGRTIAAVGRAVPVGDAEVIDASGMLVLPGFVDTHRHTWQSVVRAGRLLIDLDRTRRLAEASQEHLLRVSCRPHRA